MSHPASRHRRARARFSPSDPDSASASPSLWLRWLRLLRLLRLLRWCEGTGGGRAKWWCWGRSSCGLDLGGGVLSGVEGYNVAVMKRQVQVVAVFFVAMVTWGGWSFAAPPESLKTTTATWDWATDLRADAGSRNPLPDGYGFGNVWHLLRTTRSQGPMATRTWQRDGRYAMLKLRGDRLFSAPISAWAFRLKPSALAPFAGRYTSAQNIGVSFKAGDVVIAPGPDHAIVVGWRSPVTGILEIQGEFQHAQSCCGVNSQINWYVERGPAPDPLRGFRPVSLAKGRSDFGTSTEHGRFHLKDLKVKSGDFVYFIVDCVADGTSTPHYGDATRLVAKLTVRGATLPKPPSYEKVVRPLLAKHCVGCHGQETREGRLDLRTLAGILAGGESGPAIVRGDPQKSFLVQLVHAGEMPPRGEEKLAAAERLTLSRWVLAGAPADDDPGDVPPLRLVSDEDRKHWSFQKPRRPRAPVVRAVDRVRSPVDAFVLSPSRGRGPGVGPRGGSVGVVEASQPRPAGTSSLAGCPVGLPRRHRTGCLRADDRPPAG